MHTEDQVQDTARDAYSQDNPDLSFPSRMLQSILQMQSLQYLVLDLPHHSFDLQAKYLSTFQAASLLNVASLSVYGDPKVAQAIVRTCNPTHLKTLYIEGFVTSEIFQAATERHGATLERLHLRTSPYRPSCFLGHAIDILPIISEAFPHLEWLVLMETPRRRRPLTLDRLESLRVRINIWRQLCW